MNGIIAAETLGGEPQKRMIKYNPDRARDDHFREIYR